MAKTTRVTDIQQEKSIMTKDPVIARAESLHDDDKILEAARVLSSTSSVKSLLAENEHLTNILEKAKGAQNLVDELKIQADSKVWKRQGVSKGPGNHHTLIYHNV